MARGGNARPAPRPTTITECARRYHACALALSRTLGLSLQETLTQHRESVTAIYIESSKCEVRLPGDVTLPTLATAVGSPVAQATPLADDPPDDAGAGEPSVTDVPPRTNGHAIPTTVPAGFPNAGVRVSDLKPAVLHMLLAKTASLVHAEGGRWAPLLGALQAERQRRIAQGQRRPMTATREPGEEG